MRNSHMTMLNDNEVFLAWSATGSRVIENPPPLGRDEDWIVLADDLSEATNILMRNGFGPDAQKLYGNTEFVSFRKGQLNLIVTEQRWLYDRYVIATDVAKQLNLRSRADRVRLFQTIREVNRPNPFSIPHAHRDPVPALEKKHVLSDGYFDEGY